MGNQTYLIGQAARLADVTIDTIRYYEKQGLLKPVSRRESGYRQFDNETVRRLRFIKRAQELGFTLREIDELMLLASDDEATCADVRSLTQRKLEDVQQRIDSLVRLKAVLSELIVYCVIDGPRTECPILESLTEDNLNDAT